eukprot:scaffold1055_cov165-Amphora_coffeaeformis.AAC.13
MARESSVLLQAVLLSSAIARTTAWGSSSGTNYGIYGNSLERDWLYNAKGVSIKVEGCLWSYWQDKDEEESGCLEESSEDGTTYWYMMSNCRRAQVVWSVYASDSSSSPNCNSGNFKESFVTTAGVSEFIYYLTQYDANNPFGGNADSYNGNYPMCENGVGMTCASDGSFALEYFDDSYCMEKTDKTYDQLQTLNSNMKTYTNCQNVYQYGDQYGNVLVPYLMSISYPCSSVVSGMCEDNSAAETRQELSSSNGGGSLKFSRKSSSAGRQTWLTKLKYVAGGLLLLASFVMFTGILFTNRRRRRALMQRKYRQARRSGDDRSRRSSRSKSKSRGERDSSRKSRRSSRSRDARDKEKAGVLT